jgi:hypothetical protein
VGVSVPCGEHSNQDAVLITSQTEGLFKAGDLIQLSDKNLPALVYAEHTYALAKADRSVGRQSTEPYNCQAR